MPQTDTIRILVADDHPILRKTLASYLSQEPEIQIVGGVGSTQNLLEEIQRTQPDILLLDANMPGPGALATVGSMQQECPNVQILILSASKNRKQVLDLLTAGIRGYVLKEDNPEELIEAIRAVAAGDEWFSPSITTILVDSLRHKEKIVHINLTSREQEVLRLMVTGVGNEDIANRLYIATNTVKNHVRNIFRKLEVNTRVEAVVYALDNHLFDDMDVNNEG